MIRNAAFAGATSDWSVTKSFGLRGRHWLVWRALGRISPRLAARYVDHLVRGQVARHRDVEPGNGPLTAIGPFGLNIGIARAAEILCGTLEAAGHPIHRIDCSGVLRPKARPQNAHAQIPSEGTLLFCVNPPQLANVLRHFGPRICKGKRLIGYWWWELDRLPASWLNWAALMDEIWVSSRYIHETFSRALPGKVIRYVPLPVPEPQPSAATRADFNLHPDRFTALAVLDLASGWERKNPRGAIEAFQLAFPDANAAQLVIKVNGADRYIGDMGRLCAMTVDMPNVRIIHQNLTNADMAALVRSVDAYLSLHRAEGLGLVVAEALWLGVPIVATGWSGVLDMLDERNALLVRHNIVPVRPADYPSVPPGSTWADPDIQHAASCLRRLAAEPALRQQIAANARQSAATLFDRQRFLDSVATLVG